MSTHNPSPLSRLVVAECGSSPGCNASDRFAPRGWAVHSAFVLLVLSACVYIPLPWDAWRYESANIGKYYITDIPEEDEKHAEFFVNGAFVNVFVRAHNETTQGGDPPYGMIINIVGPFENYREMTVFSVSLHSSQGATHIATPIEVDSNAAVVRVLEFPVQSAFKPLNGWGGRGYASLWIDETLEFDPENGEEITVTLDIEVTGKSDVSRRKVRYLFVPIHESGEIGYLE